MPFRRLITIIVFLVLNQALPVYAKDAGGFKFSNMRIVFLEKDKAGAFVELENGNASPFLIQSWIVPTDAQSGLPTEKNASAVNQPFVITPPLHRLESGERYRWRIQQVSKTGLTTDRESVFYVALKAIPATDKQSENKGEFVLSPIIYQKLLYRPTALETLRTDMVADQATFRREGEQLIVSNPSPLYMTFATLQVGNYTVADDELYKMVPPFGEQRYSLPKNVTGNVMWRLLNEYALATKAELRPL
ncbi:fimbrial biogenesis chaperone [Pragia fontium]|uniref:fimbrial biogenesis chaperone n=1 Tax=Pragia fontium TaxID=82985 RepID=UPI000F70A79B|nr:molecular chaperone [Pragia fontium]VEJ55496.1 Chaperone protein fimC precursor [Pragia fontium]